GEFMHSDFEKMYQCIYEIISQNDAHLKSVDKEEVKEFRNHIINMLIAITPIAEIIGQATKEQTMELAKTLDKAATELGVDFIGGFSALIHKGISTSDQTLLDAIREALSSTERVCSSMSVATTRSGVYKNAVI